jgi:hypothetical protein
MDGISGSAILYDVFGEREDYIVHQAPQSQAEAQASSVNRYLEQARSFVRGSGSASGDPGIRAGFPLDLGGLGKLFDGLYYVTRATHRFDAGHGYTTDFEVERPAIGRLYKDDDDSNRPGADTKPKEEPPDRVEAPRPGMGHQRGSRGSGPAKERKS